jgi:hypothetical protein
VVETNALEPCATELTRRTREDCFARQCLAACEDKCVTYCPTLVGTNTYSWHITTVRQAYKKVLRKTDPRRYDLTCNCVVKFTEIVRA